MNLSVVAKVTASKNSFLAITEGDKNEFSDTEYVLKNIRKELRKLMEP